MIRRVQYVREWIHPMPCSRRRAQEGYQESPEGHGYIVLKKVIPHLSLENKVYNYRCNAEKLS